MSIKEIMDIMMTYKTDQQHQNVQIRLCSTPVSAGPDRFQKLFKVQSEAMNQVFVRHFAWRLFVSAMSRFLVCLKFIQSRLSSVRGSTIKVDATYADVHIAKGELSLEGKSRRLVPTVPIKIAFQFHLVSMDIVLIFVAHSLR